MTICIPRSVETAGQPPKLITTMQEKTWGVACKTAAIRTLHMTLPLQERPPPYLVRLPLTR